MVYRIERVKGQAGYERCELVALTEDGQYPDAAAALRDYMQPDVEVVAVRDDFATADLPTAGRRYSDGWICEADPAA